MDRATVVFLIELLIILQGYDMLVFDPLVDLVLCLA